MEAPRDVSGVSSPSSLSGSRFVRDGGYVGGFSTSLCDFFSDPRSKTDCCALACCGVLSGDRNRYLLLGERPLSLWRRMGVAFGPLLILFMGLSVVNTLIIQSNPPDTDRKDLQIPPNLGILSQLFGWAIFLYSAVLLVRASYERAKFRRRLMIRLRDGTIPDDDSSSLLTSQQDAQLAWQQKGAHRTCGCYSYDTISPLPTRAADQMTTGYQQARMMDDEDDDFEEDTIPPDLCTCIWKALSAMCCGYCCGCWCQCCGMCATGQEEREINRLVPKQERMMDYVTFEVRYNLVTIVTLSKMCDTFYWNDRYCFTVFYLSFSFSFSQPECLRPLFTLFY